MKSNSKSHFSIISFQLNIIIMSKKQKLLHFLALVVFLLTFFVGTSLPEGQKIQDWQESFYQRSPLFKNNDLTVNYSIRQAKQRKTQQNDKTEFIQKRGMTVEPQSRMLQDQVFKHKHQNPTNIKIRGVFLDDIGDQFEGINILGIQLSKLKRVFEIGTSYYSRVLSVNRHPDLDLNIQDNQRCNHVPYPQFLKNNQIDEDQVDLFVLISIANDSSVQSAARAGPCIIYRGPVVGQIQYFVKFIKPWLQSETNTFSSQLTWYKSVLTTVHNLAHILGFSINYYFQTTTKFYKSPNSDQRIQRSQLLTRYNSRFYVTQGRISKYIQNHFKCLPSNRSPQFAPIGAILRSSDLSHWDQLIYSQEIMQPSDNSSIDLRISKLTLLFLQITGFYTNVNIDLGYQLDRGKDQGCDFMDGSSFIQYQNGCLNSKLNQCSITNRWIGKCNTNTYSVSQEKICQVQNTQLSRCFQDNSAQQANCYEAFCKNSNQIAIKVGSNSYSCVKGVTSFILVSSQITIYCPNNYQLFCQQDFCLNVRQRECFCVDGRCHTVECPQQYFGCKFCSYGNYQQDQKCDKCLDGLQFYTKNQNICYFRTLQYQRQIKCNNNIQSCRFCSFDKNINLICIQCQQGYKLTQINQTIICSKTVQDELCRIQISKCSLCDLNNKNQIVCLRCSTGFGLYDEKNCLSCSVNDCSQCRLTFFRRNHNIYQYFRYFICTKCKDQISPKTIASQPYFIC